MHWLNYLIGLKHFRNFPNVKKGSNLTIYCILKTIHLWRTEHNGNYTEELYIQMDGGPENANKFVLGFLEMLVAKRLIKRIFYTRLPVGHTHEDIDACFGLIWNWFRKQNIQTPEKFKIELERALKDSRIPTEIIDVFAVPNYKTFLAPHIDQYLSHLHKLDETVHQWKFEAVAPDSDFPLGVKTMYRMYASDQVIKIDKVAQFAAKTVDATLTGQFAYTLLVQWEPAVCPDEKRMVEGTYLLNSLPTLPEGEKLKAAPFEINSHTYELIIVDFSDKKIIFIDPSQPDDEHHKTLNMQRMNELVTPLKIFLQSLPNCPETLGNFPSEIQSYNTLPNYSFRSYDRLSNNNQNDAGVYLLIILELIYHDAPLVFFSSDMDIFRTYYFSCLLKCEIPQVWYA